MPIRFHRYSGDKDTEKVARRYWTTRRARQMSMGVTIIRTEMSGEVGSSKYPECDSSHPDCRSEGRRGPEIDWGDEPTKREEKHGTVKQGASDDNMGTLAVGRKVTFGGEVYIPQKEESSSSVGGGMKEEEGESVEASGANPPHFFSRWRSLRSRCLLSKRARSKSLDGGKST
ncbi:uncharacterized protein LOC143037261 [Oratosquilla oratoria]|uniref:uncharacterized protein LOC143037261 n=1 Tax=Oratosquilla oratoria TaxID=337810 RepID=UPI003F76B3FA